MALGTQAYSLPQTSGPQPIPPNLYNLPPSQPAPLQDPRVLQGPATQMAPAQPLPTFSQNAVPSPSGGMGGMPSPQQQPTQPSAPVPLPVAWQQYASGLGHPPTRKDYDQFSLDYKTQFVDPSITAIPKIKPQQLKAYQAEYELRARQLGDRLFPGDQADNSHWYSGFGKALGEGAAGEAQKLGGGALAFLGALGNRVVGGDFGDSLMRQGNGNIVHGHNQAGQDREQFLQMMLGHNYNDPQYAVLQNTLGKNFDAANGGASTMAAEGNQDLAQAQQTNRGGALLGQAGVGAIPVAAATLATGGADIPLLAAGGATALANTTGNVADQMNAGQDSDAVLRQGVADSAIGTLLNVAPVHTPGAKFLKRIGQAGAVNAGMATGQQLVDQGLNNSNQFSGESVLQQGLMGALLGILGGNKEAINSKNPLKRRSQVGKTPPPEAVSTEAPTDGSGNPPPPGAGASPIPEGAEVLGTQVDGSTVVRMPDGHIAMIPAGTAPAAGNDGNIAAQYNAAVNTNAHATGMTAEQHANSMKEFTKELNGQGRSRTVKAIVKYATTPESAVDGAVQLARHFVPDEEWNAMSAEQRQFAVEEAATYLTKRNPKLDAGAIDQTIQQFGKPAEAPAAAAAETTPPSAQPAAQPTPAAAGPTGGEQPLPSDISGRQVPGTAAQAPTPNATIQSVTAGVLDGTDIPTQAKMLYGVATGDVQNPQLHESPLGKAVMRLVQQGNVSSEADVQKLLTGLATSKAAPGNKVTPKAPEAPAPTPTPAAAPAPKTNAEQAQDHDNVASTVTEALAPQGTAPTATNKLKARVRKNAEQKYNEQYMQAAMNAGVSGGAGEDAFRSDPHFLAVKTAIQDGRISTPEQLGAFLKNERDIAEKANQQVTTPVTKPKGLKKPAAPPPEPAPAAPVAKPKPLKGGAAKPPKSEAPVANTGAAVTELDQQLRDRFADTLPQHTIDQIHDAVATARMGDSHDLGDLLDGWKQTGDLTNDDVKWLRQQAKTPTMAKATKPLKRTPASLKEDVAEARANESEPNDDYLNDEYHQNNASGESSASLEAQNRLRDERTAGQTRAIIRRDGSVEPLSGVDAVDTHARPGEVVVQRGVGKDDWTVMSHGDDLTGDTAVGKLNRAKGELDQVHEGAQTGGHEESNFGPHGEYTLHMDDLEQMADERHASTVGTEKEVDKIAPVQTKRRVGEIINHVREGADIHETGAELQKLHDDMEAAKMERALRDMGRKPRRGVEYVRQRLQEMIASHEPGSDHYEAGKFAQWLLDKNPNLANYLAVRIHDLGEKGPGGRFSPSQRLFHINSTATNPGTAVHEIMHSAEQLMPEDMQNDIRNEYIGRLQNKLKQVIKNGNKDGERFIQLAIENYAHPSLEAEKEMSLLMRTSKKLPYDEFYKYKNPSEYWAVESTDLLNNRWVKNGKADRIKQWLGGFFQHIKSMLGLDSNHKVSRALDAILKSPGEDYNERMLSSPRGKGEVNDELHDALHEDDEGDDNEEAQAKPVHDNSAETRGFSGVVNHIIEQGMNAHVGVEMALQGLRRLGVKITADNNVDYAISRTRGLRSEHNMTDSYDVFKPFRDWVNKNFQRFGNTMDDSLRNINMFFQNTHWLERVRTAWLMQAPMKSAAMEVQRAKLLDDVQNLKVDPAVAAKQLETMKSDMKYGWEQWGRNHNVPIDVINKKLNELKLKYGMDQNSMAELNNVMEGARQRQTQRLQDAGVVSKDDPWVKLYGWKWYVPLKSAKKTDTPFWGIAQNGNLSLARLNSTMAAMEGRSTFSESPVFRLYADTAQAGNAHANATLGDALYNLVSDKKARKALGADIETWEGTPHDGYKNASTGEYTESLKMEPNQVLVHDGRTHYVITFPKDSQMARGLWKMNNIAAPDPLGRQVGKVTNAIARIQTTLSPVWQTFTAYARDMTYVPAVLATTRFDNPLEAVPFFAHYGVNALKSIAALRQIAPALKSDHLALERMAKADPNSWAAWTLRYMRLGGNNEFVGGFNTNDIQDRLGTGGFNNIPRSADGVWDATKLGWNTVLKYTNRYADFVTQIPRVAAFRTLVEQGIDERDAAAEARRVLDYGESGVQGRRINAYKAFFRVAATGVDAMRRSFVKPTGGYDFPKMAKWLGFYSMLGAAGYMTSSMMLGQDEDGKDNIAKMLPETIATRVLFPIGDQVAGWQMGLGLPQIMMAPGALMAAVAAGHVSPEDAADTYAKLVARNSAIETGGSVDHTPLGFLGSLAKGAITPTAVQPLEDIANNVNHWGVPIHGDARKGHFAADSGRKSTPDVFKEQAQWLNSLTNGTIDFYPEDIQYMVRNYGGQWAGTLISQLESQSMTPKTALPIPGLVKDQDFYQQRQLYDTLGQLDNANKRYNAIVDHAVSSGMSPEQAKQQADLTVARDPDMQKQRQLYSVLQSAAGQRAQEMKALQANKFISPTGRELRMKQIDSKLRRTLDSVTDKMP